MKNITAGFELQGAERNHKLFFRRHSKSIYYHAEQFILGIELNCYGDQFTKSNKGGQTTTFSAHLKTSEADDYVVCGVPMC